MVNVLIVEKSPMIKRLLELLICEEPSYRITEFIDSAEDVEIACRRQTIDMVLMDLDYENAETIFTACKNMKQNNPRIKSVVMTSYPENSYLQRAKEADIDSFWYKWQDTEALLNVMKQTVEGENVYPETSYIVKIGNAYSNDFSERELTVLREIVKGAIDTEIAEKMSISLRTVKTHLQNMREKTGFRNRTELAVAARGQGLVIIESGK